VILNFFDGHVSHNVSNQNYDNKILRLKIIKENLFSLKRGKTLQIKQMFHILYLVVKKKN